MSANASPAPRVLLLAPFERGIELGGSQRATAMAERLEERGARVTWSVVRARQTPRYAKLAPLLSLRPAIVSLYPVRSHSQAYDCDIAIASHSYLAPQLDALPPSVPRMIDFHNLEWRHLADVAAPERGLRRLYMRLQADLMRRFELARIGAADLSIFASAEELGWARSALPEARTMLVPSVLPGAMAATLEAAEPDRCAQTSELLYMGTLTFPPNQHALLAFLEEVWPEVRKTTPQVRLSVAGDCPAAIRERIDAVPGVHSLGFVEDLWPLARRAAAVIMPSESSAGTSLRALAVALAGIPAIGPAAAFRGLPWSGIVVDSSQQWARAVRAAVSGADGSQAEVTTAARTAALAVQRDAGPWDALLAELRAAASSPSR